MGIENIHDQRDLCGVFVLGCDVCHKPLSALLFADFVYLHESLARQRFVAMKILQEPS